MLNLKSVLLAAMLASLATMSFAVQTTAAPAGSVYAAKKAECTRKADQRKWGIHRIQRSNWINDCIAGKN
jgi:hypothetical protein